MTKSNRDLQNKPGVMFSANWTLRSGSAFISFMAKWPRVFLGPGPGTCLCVRKRRRLGALKEPPTEPWKGP